MRGLSLIWPLQASVGRPSVVRQSMDPLIQSAMRRFSQRNHLVTLSEINITPLLDLAFVLLIIFIITTPLLTQSIELRLPRGGQPDKRLNRRTFARWRSPAPGYYKFEARQMALPQIISAAGAGIARPIRISSSISARTRNAATISWRKCLTAARRTASRAIRCAPTRRPNEPAAKKMSHRRRRHASPAGAWPCFAPASSPSKPKPDDSQVLDVIPANLIDAAFNSGVQNAQPPPPAPMVKPPEPQPQPTPEPPKPEVKPVEPVTPPEKNQPEDLKPAEKPETEKPKPKEHVIKPDLTPVVRKKTVEDKSAAETERAAKEAKRVRDARLKAIRDAARAIEKNASSSTTVDMPGDSTVAYANYASIVKSVYTQAWIPPTDTASDDANVKVSVTIASDGTGDQRAHRRLVRRRQRGRARCKTLWIASGKSRRFRTARRTRNGLTSSTSTSKPNGCSDEKNNTQPADTLPIARCAR